KYAHLHEDENISFLMSEAEQAMRNIYMSTHVSEVRKHKDNILFVQMWMIGQALVAGDYDNG
ncbi:MAG: hypothetical protein MJH10_19610, partial [Epibacterium sp.]|nr:hypothetical protein [Epibacterium sp.]NQX75692.1 hypothetical protein [Epibacterium sp.]